MTKPKFDDTRVAVRPSKADDIAPLQAVLDGTELFPSEMLPDMIGGFLNPSSGDEPSDLWLTATLDGEPMGLCFAKPEDLTDGTWNMLALAVLPSNQGAGLGAHMTSACETAVKERGARILIVDTSGTDDFALTREFYEKQRYEPEARIRDYWAEGDDKVTLRKKL